MISREELVRRVRHYVSRKGSVAGKQLGAGVHGSVFSIQNQSEPGSSAVKGFEREADYRRERDVYLRLHERAISRIRGCAVPDRTAALFPRKCPRRSTRDRLSF